MQPCSTKILSQAMTNDVALDIYAMTNPAFWALALTQFVDGYQTSTREGMTAACPYPLLFLPMPLAFSRDALARFHGTNRNTGLLTWLERHPIVRATAADEIRVAKPYARRALTFALAHGVLVTPDGWGYGTPSKRGWKKPSWPVKSDPRGALLQASHRLGQWCGGVDTTTVFIALGVRP
jgi:Family of unknown function (DUF6521)